MQITQVADSAGGPAAELGASPIDAPIGEPPLRSFRRTFYLDFETGGEAEALLVDRDASQLVGEFLPLDYDARTIDGATITQFDSTRVVVDLTAPRHLLKVHFRSAKVSGAGYTLQLFRLEPEQPAGEPFLTRVNGMITAPVFEIDQIERRFLMRVLGPGGNPIAFSVSDIEEICVRGYPTNPRIGIAFPDAAAPEAEPAPGDAVFFWRAPGEVGGGAAAAEAEFDETSRFGSELERLGRRYTDQRGGSAPAGSPPPILPSPLTVALVVESDAPCRIDRMSLDVRYRLGRSSFSSGEPKQVLRFGSGRRSARSVEFLVPVGAVMHEALLTMDAKLPGDRAADGGKGGGAGEGEIVGRTGTHVRKGIVAAQPFTPPGAVLVTGVSLGLLPTASGTELEIELHEDSEGRPGRTLAIAALPIGEPGHADWVAARFADPVLLPTRLHWILLRSSAGSAIWLTADDEMETVYVLEPGGATGRWRDIAALTGRCALHALRTRAGESGRAPALAVRVAESQIAVVPGAKPNTLTADLTPALAAHHPTATASDAGLVPVPLVIDGFGPGVVTAYPPELIYDLI